MAVRADLSPARLKISFLQTYLCSETERSARRGHSVGTPREDTPRGHPAAAVRCGGTRRLLSAGAVIGAAAPRYRRARAVGGRQLRGDRRGTPPAVPPPRAPALRSPTNTFTVHRAGEKSRVPAPSGRFSRGIKGEGVISLLRPLLLDVVPTIQQTAALALGRLAYFNDDLAEAVVKEDILPQLVCSLSEQNRFYKKAAAFVLRAVGKHSPQLAQAIVECGALEALVICLEDFDPGVKEGAAWALGYIARHNSELSQAVVDAGAVPLLVLCIQEPEIALKRIAASTLSDISKHSPELAQTVVDAGAIAYLAQMILNPDAKLKCQVLSALSQIAKHSVDLAELVVEAEIFPVVLTCMKDSDEYVKKNGATLIREIAKHSPELSQFIVNAGGVAAVIDCIGSCKGTVRLPGIMMLGYVAAHSENLSMAVIVSKGIPPLCTCLLEEHEDHIKAAAAWALGQIGRHTPEHARAVAETNVLGTLLSMYMDIRSSEDLQLKAKRALKNILQKCTYLPALEPLLHDAPPNIMKHIVGQFSKVLPHDSKARRLFVTSGGLKKVQEIKAEPGSLLQEYINTINNCYPEEVVRYYSPGYSEMLLERVENYQPVL
ncbi:sperm-associated antigen 6 isoform X1 [Gallus gallus]|uniref:sperm-associated antigen 6 isoform X1 n=1 Tax=Gallus gallus TaxID=9031 RepID=UPI000D63F925|nr:sperm-associated antigen 6 isoform X1 [Gallus gallus]XP_046766956.1 sperm-associated antigen 6 isoform X1 [Gallus gallus]|eukprot:XP_025002950.1 sperm-associated antigen 6 isoform X1 [Gallus gallus]